MPDPRLIASLTAVYVIWSSTYLAMRVAVVELPPLLTAAVRFFSVGAVLLAIGKWRGARWPSASDWKRSVPAGLGLFLGGNGLVFIASQSLSSGGVAIVCAMMPLWIGVLGMFVGEHATTREWVSLVVGFVGVVILLGGPSLAGEPAHIVALVLAPILWAAGSLAARRASDIGGAQASFVSPALQMLTGGAGLATIGLLRGERMPIDASAEVWVAFAYLWLFGSLIAFTAYAWLLRHARPVIATSYAYVNPPLAVLIGAALYGESLDWTTGVANALIVAAVMLALTGRASRT